MTWCLIKKTSIPFCQAMAEKISLKSLYASYAEHRIQENDESRAKKAQELERLHRKYKLYYMLDENIRKQLWQAIDDGMTESTLVDELEQPEIALYDFDLRNLFENGIDGTYSLAQLIKSKLSDEFEIVYRVSIIHDTSHRRFQMLLKWRVD